jgi:hypothetical protein
MLLSLLCSFSVDRRNLADNLLTGTIPQGWIRFLKNLNLGAASNRYCPIEDYSSWASNSDYASVSCEACSPLQCQYGECRYANSQYTCLCNPGYAGMLCDTRTVCPNVTESGADWAGLGATTVVSSCAVGYTGTPSRDCLSEGVWGPIQNPCIRMRPSLLPSKAGREQQTTTTNLKRKKKKKERVPACLNSHSSSPPPFAAGNTCQALAEQQAVWPLSNSLTTVTGSCETGYSGNIQRTCQADGSWGTITGVCTRKEIFPSPPFFLPLPPLAPR